MPRSIFVNLPVSDLERSQAFFAALGFSFNPQFTNEIGACMIIDSSSFVMLVTKPFFQTFTPNPIADARATTEVLVALSYDSKAEVMAMIEKAVSAGGNTYGDPKDHGFMYQHGFQDVDGHIWEVFWMNPDHVQPTA